MSEKKKGTLRGRDWSFIVYPESAPENWREIIDSTFVRWVESPLHDKDVNPNGELKKPHWHILLSYDGPVGINPILEITNSLNSPAPQKVGSAKGLVRYMIHMDNPEKFQYDKSDIVPHGGADIENYFELTSGMKMEVLKEMMIYIYDNRIDNFAELIMICISKSDDWFDMATNRNTLALNKMVDAMWQKNKRKDI